MIIRARRTHDHSLQRVQADSDRRTEESAALSEAREYLEEYERLVEHLKKHIPEDFFKKQRLSFSRTSLNLLDFIAVSALLAVALGIVSNFHYSIDHLSDETSWGFVASLIGIVWRGFAHSYHSVSEATSMGASFLTIGFALFFGIQFKESKSIPDDEERLLLSITTGVNTVGAAISWSIFPAACGSGNVGTTLFLITIIVVQCMLASLTRLPKKQTVASLSEACSMARRAAEKRQDFIESGGSESGSTIKGYQSCRSTYGCLLLLSFIVAFIVILLAAAGLCCVSHASHSSGFMNYRTLITFVLFFLFFFAVHLISELRYKNYRADRCLRLGSRLYLVCSNLILLTPIITATLIIMIKTYFECHFVLLICEIFWLLSVVFLAFPIISWNKTLLSRMICRSLTIEVIRRYRTATYFKDELSRYN